MKEGSGLAAVHAAAMSETSAVAIAAAAAAAAANPAPAAPAAAAAPAAGTVSEADYQAKVASAKAEGNKAGVTAERARVKAIITAPEAKGRESLAHHIAFDTDLTSEQAVGMLKASPEAATRSRLEGNVPQPRVETAEGGTDAKAASQGLAAAVQRQVERRFGKSAA